MNQNMSTRKNPWGRGPDAEPEQPVTDLTENAFKRQRTAIAARHVADAATAADTKKIKAAAQKHFDETHRRTTTGVLMDPALAAAEKEHTDARVARNNSTEAQAPENDPFIAEKLRAMVRLWLTETPDGQNLYTIFEDSPLTNVSLSNATQYLLKAGHPLSLQMIQNAYTFCAQNNKLELRGRRDEDGCIVRARGEATPLPPTLFPPVQWSDDEAADNAERIEKARSASEAEAESAKALPLAELQKQVRAKFKISKD
jgi:hypothetical protein